MYLLALGAGWIGFPIFIGVAVLRYRLYSIDILIRRTLIYSILTATVALLYFSSIVLLRGLVETLTGQVAQSPLIIVLTTLGIAAVFHPLRARIQDAVDRRFFRRRYNAKQTLASFSSAIRSEVDVEHLTGDLLRTVEETIQPFTASVWIRKS